MNNNSSDYYVRFDAVEDELKVEKEEKKTDTSLINEEVIHFG